MEDLESEDDMDERPPNLDLGDKSSLFLMFVYRFSEISSLGVLHDNA
jgi:hypothetical protein